MFAPRGLANRSLLLIGGDFGTAVVTAYGTRLLVGHDTALPTPNKFNLVAGLLGLTYVAAIYFQDLYALERPRSRSAIVASLVAIGVTLAACFAMAQLASPELALGRRFYLSYIACGTVTLATWRLAIHSVMLRHGRLGVMVLGVGESGPLIAEEVRKREHLGYNLLGFIEKAVRSETPVPMPEGGKLYALASLGDWAPPAPVSALIIPDRGNLPFNASELLQWRLRGVDIVDFESFYERLTGRLPVTLLQESWLVFAPGFQRSRASVLGKRVLDIVAALVVGAVGMAIAALTAVAIKLDSPGPVLYWQERVGHDGKVFRLYKFRSMQAEAEAAGKALWAKTGDTRITRVGRVIRRLRIDELPQLFNVLKGEMSIVGPRPERPQIVAELSRLLPLYAYRHTIRPGLTGWAQVCFRYGASVDDSLQKLCYDLYYVKNWSLLLDIQILVQTIKVIVLGRGAR